MTYLAARRREVSDHCRLVRQRTKSAEFVAPLAIGWKPLTYSSRTGCIVLRIVGAAVPRVTKDDLQLEEATFPVQSVFYALFHPRLSNRGAPSVDFGVYHNCHRYPVMSLSTCTLSFRRLGVFHFVTLLRRAPVPLSGWPPRRLPSR